MGFHQFVVLPFEFVALATQILKLRVSVCARPLRRLQDAVAFSPPDFACMHRDSTVQGKLGGASTGSADSVFSTVFDDVAPIGSYLARVRVLSEKLSRLVSFPAF